MTPYYQHLPYVSFSKCESHWSLIQIIVSVMDGDSASFPIMIAKGLSNSSLSVDFSQYRDQLILCVSKCNLRTIHKFNRILFQ